MTDADYDLLDELYFVTPFRTLLEKTGLPAAELEAQLRRLLEQGLVRSYWPDPDTELAYETTSFVKASIEDVVKTLLEAIALQAEILELRANPDRAAMGAVIEAKLREYFAGTRTDFDLPVSLVGTEFQKAVWGELATLPFGGVVSYGDIGQATGRATAGRAVGGAVGANPIPIIVPCHRVLASDGRITGYSGGNGIPTKVWLLDHEGIAHR